MSPYQRIHFPKKRLFLRFPAKNNYVLLFFLRMLHDQRVHYISKMYNVVLTDTDSAPSYQYYHILCVVCMSLGLIVQVSWYSITQKPSASSHCLFLESINETFYSIRLTLCTISYNVQKFCVLPTEYIYVFCVDLRTNSDYFSIQH
jgi:hypothetical protein